jgi:hypothetical protein
MNVRLIKLDDSSVEEDAEQLPVEIPIIDTIRSWVTEFRAAKADNARLDFEQVNNGRGRT